MRIHSFVSTSTCPAREATQAAAHTASTLSAVPRYSCLLVKLVNPDTASCCCSDVPLSRVHAATCCSDHAAYVSQSKVPQAESKRKVPAEAFFLLLFSAPPTWAGSRRRASSRCRCSLAWRCRSLVRSLAHTSLPVATPISVAFQTIWMNGSMVSQCAWREGAKERSVRESDRVGGGGGGPN